MRSGKTILVHNGALGDFLLAWPALLSLVRHAQARGEETVFAGKTAYVPVLEPLGVRAASPAERQAASACYGATSWPDVWPDVGPDESPVSRLVWFGLERPPLPPALLADPRCWFLPSLRGDAPPRETLRQALAERDVPWIEDAVQEFQRRHGRWSPPPNAPATLFPGAGHPLKAWPLDNFLNLGRALQAGGVPVRCVLGPDERERGWRVEGLPTIAPASLMDLLAVLRGSRFVVGNDSGPLHLAGLLDVPGVALFGPTSRRQWGPRGLRHLAASAPCRPCTRSTHDLRCAAPACMEAIAVDAVLAALASPPPENEETGAAGSHPACAGF